MYLLRPEAAIEPKTPNGIIFQGLSLYLYAASWQSG